MTIEQIIEKAKNEYLVLEKKRKVMLGEVEEKIKKVREEKAGVILARQKAIIQALEDSFRLTELTKTVIAWRKKVLKSREVKSILEKYGVAIEEVALVECWDENWEFRKNFDSLWISSDLGIKNPYAATFYRNDPWKLTKRYQWGGPKDSIQILFKSVPGSGYQISGVFVNREAFPKSGVFALFKKGKNKTAHPHETPSKQGLNTLIQGS